MQFWAVCSIFSTITLSKPQITTWDPYNSCICFYTDKANATVTYKLLHTKLCINLQYQTTYQNAYHTAVNRKFSCVHQTGEVNTFIMNRTTAHQYSVCIVNQPLNPPECKPGFCDHTDSYAENLHSNASCVQTADFKEQ